MLLIFNIGSASFKYTLFDENLKTVDSKTIEYPKEAEIENAVKNLLKLPKLPNFPSIIGHRVVHGGERFYKPTKITPQVFQELKKISSLAPLHNPPVLKVIKLCLKIAPKIPNFAVFDTGFFKDLPKIASTYALPFGLCQRYHIKRYSFHGISHQYVAEETSKKLGRPFEELKLITCHLGAGSSITAIKKGKPIDTSMGFTPLEGLVMATRCGDIDPAIVIYLQKEVGFSIDEVDELLNKKSGLLGISGLSSDLRDLTAAYNKDKRAKIAIDIYCYKIKKYIGAYAVALEGLDALIFTGAVGEGNKFVREKATKGLKKVLGDFEILVIPTDEELAIAKALQTLRV